MSDVKFREMNPTVGTSTEAKSAIRRTGWFPVSDLSRKVFIRRINARHKSSQDLTITLYTDGDDSVVTEQVTFRANDGDTGLTISGSITDTGTSILTASTTLLKNGDWIKIDNEIMKIITAGTTTHTVQRGMRGTTAVSHNQYAKIYYSNYPNDSIKIGKRAKYAQVELSTGSNTGTTEINKMEIEYE